MVLFGFAMSVAGASGFRPDRLMLTWQNDPTTTMTVQWLQGGIALPAAKGGLTEAPVQAIPYVDKKVPTATGGDWEGRGVGLEYLANEKHGLFPAEEFAAEVRVGWNEKGLLVLARVTDPLAGENPDPELIWAGDSVELFVSDGVGSKHRYQVVLAPGRGEGGKARHKFFQKEGGPAVEGLAVEYAVKTDATGYVIEVLLPWANLPEIKAGEGAGVALQVYVNSQAGGGFSARRVGLHPSVNTSVDATKAVGFSLAGKDAAAAGAVRARTMLAVDAGDRPSVQVFGVAGLAGKPVELRSGSHALGGGVFAAEGGGALAEVALPEAPEGEAWGVIEVVSAGEVIGWVKPAEWGYGKRPEPGVVRYWPKGTEEGGALRATAELTRLVKWPGQYRQRVELTGLKPGTDYRFRAEGHGEEFGFRTMPATLTRPVRFAEGGDTRHEKAWMVRTNRVAMAYDPDFVVWGGDFAYANGLESNLPRWEEWFEANHEGLTGADNRVVPIMGAIGNHEVVGGYYTSHAEFKPVDEWRARIAPYFYQFFAFPGQPGYGALDFGDYLSFIVLDSGHTNPIAGAQTEWLEKALVERKGRPHVFPVYHVPAYPSQRSYDGQPTVQVRENWVPLFEKHGIEVAFEHHDHTYKRTHPIRGGKVSADGIVYIGDGAWGVKEREGASKDAWYIKRFSSKRHAIIVTLDKDGRSFLMVDEDGKVIDEYPEKAGAGR